LDKLTAVTKCVLFKTECIVYSSVCCCSDNCLSGQPFYAMEGQPFCELCYMVRILLACIVFSGLTLFMGQLEGFVK